MSNILRFIILLLSAVIVQSQETSNQTIEKFEWLTGRWNRTNVKPGRSGVEEWKKSSDSELTGSGILMNGKDTVVIEKIKIVVKDDNIYYVADVSENKDLVYFKFSTITKNSFVCENPDHDFPKRISYTYDGKVLKATISGNGKSIDYLFEKK